MYASYWLLCLYMYVLSSIVVLLFSSVFSSVVVAYSVAYVFSAEFAPYCLLWCIMFLIIGIFCLYFGINIYSN